MGRNQRRISCQDLRTGSALSAGTGQLAGTGFALGTASRLVERPAEVKTQGGCPI